MPSSKTDQFWQYGIEAILWASYAKTDDDRQGLLELARTWTQAALQERASLVDHERDRCRLRTPQLAASSFSCRKAEKNREYSPNPASVEESRFVINTRKLTMTNISKTWPARISRRSLLEGAVCATGVATIFATAAIQPVQAAKISQKVVKYQDSPKGAAMCSNCKLFVAPSSCQTVDGAISPNGWCSIYQKV